MTAEDRRHFLEKLERDKLKLFTSLVDAMRRLQTGMRHPAARIPIAMSAEKSPGSFLGRYQFWYHIGEVVHTVTAEHIYATDFGRDDDLSERANGLIAGIRDDLGEGRPW